MVTAPFYTREYNWQQQQVIRAIPESSQDPYYNYCKVVCARDRLYDRGPLPTFALYRFADQQIFPVGSKERKDRFAAQIGDHSPLRTFRSASLTVPVAYTLRKLRGSRPCAENNISGAVQHNPSRFEQHDIEGDGSRIDGGGSRVDGTHRQLVRRADTHSYDARVGREVCADLPADHDASG